MEKTENEYVTWSEESMTLMESYRFIFTDFFLHTLIFHIIYR